MVAFPTPARCATPSTVRPEKPTSTSSSSVASRIALWASTLRGRPALGAAGLFALMLKDLPAPGADAVGKPSIEGPSRPRTVGSGSHPIRYYTFRSGGHSSAKDGRNLCDSAELAAISRRLREHRKATWRAFRGLLEGCLAKRHAQGPVPPAVPSGGVPRAARSILLLDEPCPGCRSGPPPVAAPSSRRQAARKSTIPSSAAPGRESDGAGAGVAPNQCRWRSSASRK